MEEYEQGSSAIQINSVRENGQGAQKHTPGRKRAGVAPVRAGEVVDRSCKSCLASSRCPLPPPTQVPPRSPGRLQRSCQEAAGESRKLCPRRARSPRCRRWAGGREAAAAAPPAAETLDGFLTAPGSSRCLLKNPPGWV